jgi:glycosyltransferase involved in cell wall biosynthesis
MYKTHRIFVVIPAYNVLGHIVDVVSTVPHFVDRIILVDDCATDGTSHLLSSMTDSRVTVVRHEKNQGVGGAMVSGFKQALQERADIVVKMDGDGQMDPTYLPMLLDPIVEQGYLYAKGNRFLDNRQLASMPVLRLIGNYGLTFLTKLASGYWHVFDPQNGYLAIHADVLNKIDLDHLAKRYFFENDLLIHLNIFSARIKDVSIPARYGNEKSSMRMSEIILTFPRYLFRRFWYRVYQKHILRDFSPIALFWVSGVPLFLWGIFFGTYTWVKSIILFQVATTGTVMLSVLPFLLGFQLILQAMLLEIAESPK